MDAAFATKVGLTAVWSLGAAMGILSIGRERKPLSSGVMLATILIIAAESFALWRWL